jgi:chromosomal replication initiator protein
LQQKRPAQDELARLIDTLLESNTLVLLTANVAPTTDIRLQPRLRSRLSAGLPVALTVPGIPARRLLLRRLAEAHKVHLTDAAIELLAGDSSDANWERLTVPQLNHAVVQLGYSIDERSEVIDADRVRHFLLDQAHQRQPTFRLITAKVGKYFSLTNQELRGCSRRRHIVRARGVAMLLSWNLTKKSLESIGCYFGNRDHTTVLHACRKTESLQRTDPAIGKAIEELLSQLNTLS